MSNKGREIMFPPASPYTERVRIACEQPPIQYTAAALDVSSIIGRISRIIAQLRSANSAHAPRQKAAFNPPSLECEQCA